MIFGIHLMKKSADFAFMKRGSDFGMRGYYDFGQEWAGLA
jgi:hypothetical protein